MNRVKKSGGRKLKLEFTEKQLKKAEEDAYYRGYKDGYDESRESAARLHRIKILDKYADDILSGLKTFEVRKNDRAYQVGDILKFIAVEKDLKVLEKHPINWEEYEVRYIHSGLGMLEGYVVLGIEKVPDSSYNIKL